MAHFEFADFVEEFKVSFTVTHPGANDTYNDDGILIKSVGTTEAMTGIILPFGPDELRKNDNGIYTDYDRKVYVIKPLEKGAIVQYNGEEYEIDRELPYSAYADVKIYYARGKGPGK